jgi:hypothetical protein
MFDLFDAGERPAELVAAVSCLAEQDERERGAVFTRPEVIRAILDLAGYRVDAPLHQMRALEPSFGAGDFLGIMVSRLWASYTANGGLAADAYENLHQALLGVELHQRSFRRTHDNLSQQLQTFGVDQLQTQALVDAWLVQDDFLLCDIKGEFDFVVGNPPYVRQERIPASLLAEYRRRYRTLYDRADLYVPFFERSLDLLAHGGAVGFICSNRWLKNRYGGPLRAKLSDEFWLRYFVDLERFDAFHSDVIAYPAVTVIERRGELAEQPKPTRSVAVDSSTTVDLEAVAAALRGLAVAEVTVSEFNFGKGGNRPLLFDQHPGLNLLRQIEQNWPSIEESGCKIGIGVATGCDRVFIGESDALPVEEARKLPLVMASDLTSGKITWSGKVLVNPYEEDGSLVAPEAYPKFNRYLQAHRESIERRNVAKRNPKSWFRTIDRIQPGLREKAKLLVPDIKGEAIFAIDEGNYYPHHNLYFITSETWDLRALRTVLRSSLTLMTIALYSTRMAGGFLRFQAQYLRRIRLPEWSTLPHELRCRLIALCDEPLGATLDAPVFEMFGLSDADGALARAFADQARVSKKGTQTCR